MLKPGIISPPLSGGTPSSPQTRAAGKALAAIKLAPAITQIPEGTKGVVLDGAKVYLAELHRQFSKLELPPDDLGLPCENQAYTSLPFEDKLKAEGIAEKAYTDYRGWEE